MITRTEIDEQFEQLRPLLEHRFDVELPAELQELASEDDPGDGVSECMALIGELLDDPQSTLNRFDYQWALDASGYGSDYEAYMQYGLLKILSEINPSHPKLSEVRPMVVKLVKSPNFSTVAVAGVDVDFVCVPFGLQKFLQVVVGTLINAEDAASSVTYDESLRTSSNRIGGQSLERLVRGDPAAAHGIVMGIIDAGFALARGRAFSHLEPVTPRLMGDYGRTYPMMATLFICCELFIVCHEMEHLLNRDKISMAREISDEVGADAGGLSLLIIAAATVEGARFAAISGPVAYFQVARLYDLIRRVAAVVDPQEGAPEPSSQSEFELRLRLNAFLQGGGRMGIPKDLMAISEELADEWWLLIASCQVSLFRLIGIELTLDAALDNRPSESPIPGRRGRPA